MEFQISNMTCEGCVRSVTKAIHKVDSAATVQADLAAKKVEVKTTAARAEISTALAQAGYEVAA